MGDRIYLLCEKLETGEYKVVAASNRKERLGTAIDIFHEARLSENRDFDYVIVQMTSNLEIELEYGDYLNFHIARIEVEARNV